MSSNLVLISSLSAAVRRLYLRPAGDAARQPGIGTTARSIRSTSIASLTRNAFPPKFLQSAQDCHLGHDGVIFAKVSNQFAPQASPGTRIFIGHLHESTVFTQPSSFLDRRNCMHVHDLRQDIGALHTSCLKGRHLDCTVAVRQADYANRVDLDGG